MHQLCLNKKYRLHPLYVVFSILREATLIYKYNNYRLKQTDLNGIVVFVVIKITC